MYCWHEMVHYANKDYMFVFCSNICQVIFRVYFKTLHCVTEWAGWFRVILIPITLITSMPSLMTHEAANVRCSVHISGNRFWTLDRHFVFTPEIFWIGETQLFQYDVWHLFKFITQIGKVYFWFINDLQFSITKEHSSMWDSKPRFIRRT